MNTYRFLVTYEGRIEANDEAEARAWAAVWPITHTEVERIKPNGDDA